MRFLSGEVGELGELAVVEVGGNRSEQIGALRRKDSVGVGLSGVGALEISDIPIHRLHQLRVLQSPMGHHLHIFGLVESHGPDEVAIRHLPPCRLLRPVAVAICGVTALEPDHHDAVAVRRASSSRPQVADRTRLEFAVPDLESSVQHIRPIGRAFDHLDEHGFPLRLDVHPHI